MKNLKEFGMIVQESRKSKGISLNQLANAIKLSKDIIDKIEKGEHDIILDEAFVIKSALDLPLSCLVDLFDDNGTDVMLKLRIIEYCDELGAERVLDIIKSQVIPNPAKKP